MKIRDHVRAYVIASSDKTQQLRRVSSSKVSLCPTRKSTSPKDAKMNSRCRVFSRGIWCAFRVKGAQVPVSVPNGLAGVAFRKRVVTLARRSKKNSSIFPSVGRSGFFG